MSPQGTKQPVHYSNPNRPEFNAPWAGLMPLTVIAVIITV